MTGFDAALADLTGRIAGHHAPPLPDAYYLEAHDAFEAVSRQQPLIRDRLSALIAERATAVGRPIRLLSVGCGGGQLDIPLLEQACGLVERYTGVDPNEVELESLRAGLPQGLSADLRASAFAACEFAGEFDLSYAVHMVYYVGDVADFADRIIASVSAPGLAVVVVAPKSPMNQIADIIWRSHGVHSVFADTFAQTLDASNVDYKRERIAAEIPYEYYEDDAADARVADFTVQTRIEALPPDIRDAVYNAFRHAAVQAPGGRALEHPADLFLISTPT